MRWKLLIQTALLLAAGQLALGAVGYVARPVPGLGLVITVLMIWFVLRTSKVVRGELERVGTLAPRSQVWVAALLWQVPALISLPFWMPLWVSEVWQGSVLPVVLTLAYRWPVLPDAAIPWLWTAVVLDLLLFVVGALPPKSETVAPVRPAVGAAVSQQPESGAPREWAAARRVKDVKPTGKRIRK